MEEGEMERKLEEMVVSLELAKEMEVMGFPQDSIFYWWESECEGMKLLCNPAPIYKHEGYSAYVCEELGRMLNKYGSYESGKRLDGVVYCVADDGSQHYSLPLLHPVEETEANIRAKMCIWLRKEGLL